MSTKQIKVNERNIQSRKKFKENKNHQQTNAVSKSAHSRRAKRLERKAERKKNKKPMRRVLPIWLRIIIVLILCVVALIGGLMVGYGVLGDGVPSDVLNKETWKHIIDLVQKGKNE